MGNKMFAFANFFCYHYIRIMRIEGVDTYEF